MKLESLVLENFESWKSGFFEFHNGVNIFVGLSDTGKSAILRALRLLMENKPSGDDYRSDFTDKKAITKVKANFTDGISVSRIRGNSINQYKLKIKDEKAQIFEAFGTSVPEEILNALNLNNINLQRQIELPFLLSQNPPDRGRFFNECAGLDKIDSSQKYANIKTLESGRELDSCKKEVERINAELKELEFIPDLENQLQELNELEQEQESLQAKVIHLSRIYAQYKNAESELNEIQSIDIKGIEAKIKNTLQLISEWQQLENKIQKLTVLHEEYLYTDSELFDLEKLDYTRISEKIKTGLKLIANHQQKLSDLSRTRRSFNSYVSIQNQLKEAQERLISESKLFNAAKPDICPLCNGTGKIKDA